MVLWISCSITAYQSCPRVHFSRPDPPDFRPDPFYQKQIRPNATYSIIIDPTQTHLTYPCTPPHPFPIYQHLLPILSPKPPIFLEQNFFQRKYRGMNWRNLVWFAIHSPLTLSLFRVFFSFSHNPIFLGPCLVGYLRCYLTAVYFF